MPPIPVTPEPSDAALERALRDSRRLEDAPEHLIQRTLTSLRTQQQQKQQRKHRGAAVPGLLQRVIAALVFDSNQATGLTLGVRAAAHATRQLVYTAAEVDIDLRVAAAQDGSVQLSGQVLGFEGAGRVRLEAGGQLAAEQGLDAQGQFHIAPLAAGLYTLSLVLADTEVALPPLELEPPR